MPFCGTDAANSACVCSILSLFYRIRLNKLGDSLWNTVPVHIVGVVELTCGLCIPCMPAMYTLSQRLWPRTRSYLYRYSAASARPLRRLRHAAPAFTRGGSSGGRTRHHGEKLPRPDAASDSASDTRVDSASLARSEYAYDPNDRTKLWGWTQAEKEADEEEGLRLPRQPSPAAAAAPSPAPPTPPPKDSIWRTDEVEVSRFTRMQASEMPSSIVGAPWPR